MSKAPTRLAAPAIDCFAVEADPPPIVPASGRRQWMDVTQDRFAYRCLPMVIANASGWEVRCPFAFDAIWDGSDAVEAITVVTEAGGEAVSRRIASHFGHGILTFHVGWLFHTPPGWAMWVRGSPNHLKDGIQPLDGLVETDWLPFTFTMNWRFTRPGRVRFEQDEPFCFMTLAPHGLLDQVQPRLRLLEDEPALAADYERWQASRNDFNRRLRANEEGAVKEGWQRGYIRGAPGTRAFHISKRKLPTPE